MMNDLYSSNISENIWNSVDFSQKYEKAFTSPMLLPINVGQTDEFNFSLDQGYAGSAPKFVSPQEKAFRLTSNIDENEDDIELDFPFSNTITNSISSISSSLSLPRPVSLPSSQDLVIDSSPFSSPIVPLLSQSSSLELHQLVWAKFSEFPWWPAVYIKPSEAGIVDNIGSLSQNTFCVFFLGEHNIGFVDSNSICDYFQNFEVFKKTKYKGMKKALKEADMYVTHPDISQIYNASQTKKRKKIHEHNENQEAEKKNNSFSSSYLHPKHYKIKNENQFNDSLSDSKSTLCLSLIHPPLCPISSSLDIDPNIKDKGVESFQNSSSSLFEIEKLIDSQKKNEKKVFVSIDSSKTKSKSKILSKDQNNLLKKSKKSSSNTKKRQPTFNSSITKKEKSRKFSHSTSMRESIKQSNLPINQLSISLPHTPEMKEKLRIKVMRQLGLYPLYNID